jgi:hypothetical protein
MRRLNNQSVRTVPPIPTTTIVIPNVQLSMPAYLRIIKVRGLKIEVEG